MSAKNAGPPRSFEAAGQLFGEFLARNDYPTVVRWLTPDDVVAEQRQRYWIRDNGVKALADANRRYEVGVVRNLGIALRALCSNNTTTFATVFVPADGLSAEMNLLGEGLKLSIPSERVVASVVKNPFRWMFLRLKFRGRRRMLDV